MKPLFENAVSTGGVRVVPAPWRRRAMLAAAVAAALAAGGCGGGDESRGRDAASMNAELELRELRLKDRLDALDPARLVDGVQSVADAVAKGNGLVEGLPADETSDRRVEIAVLVRLRTGTEDAVGDFENAVAAESAAREDFDRNRRVLAAAGARAAEVLAGCEGGADAFLFGLAGAHGDVSRGLDGWCAQRLEKFENGHFATFPAFHAAASARYDEWEKWVGGVERVRNALADDCMQPAADALQGLEGAAGRIVAERDAAAAAIARVCAMPPDPALVDSAKAAELDSLDGAIRDAVSRAAKAEKDGGAELPALRERAENALARAVKLEGALAGFAASSAGAFMGDAEKARVRDAVGKARADTTAAAGATSSAETGLQSLLCDFEAAGPLVEEADEAGKFLRGGKDLDGDRFLAAVSKIESLRVLVEKVDVVARCDEFDGQLAAAAAALRSAEEVLSGAENGFDDAKKLAVAAEKKAALEETGRQVRSRLEAAKAKIAAPPPPGCVRPAGVVSSLIGTIDADLAKLGKMSMEELTAAAASVEREAARIEAETKWTPGTRHPSRPHVFAMEKENMWDADPGYWFDHPGENSDLVVSWSPGMRHSGHPHVSAGQVEGTWTPDPGYRRRWSGDLDPEWTIGERHPERPHVFASRENGKDVWDCDPGYVWDEPGSRNLDCHWTAGRRHPDHEGIESAQQEGRWNALPGWAFVNPGTSDLRTRWVPGSRYPGKPHIHASGDKWKWSADPGYDFDEYNSSNLSVHWKPGIWHATAKGVVSASREGYWKVADGWRFVSSGAAERTSETDLSARWLRGAAKPGWPHVHAGDDENKWSADDGYVWVNPNANDDFSVRWSPGWISPDGQRRAKQQEGRFETKRDCPNCENGYKTRKFRCRTCQGSGRFLFGDCPRCDGTGKETERTRCTACGGAGWRWR
ncbi:MAG: hypothetical protein IJ783_04680 [Kiritimatiellae bacterium]|nr:hypothetical protein [Kiritimatiellia bacterium]